MELINLWLAIPAVLLFFLAVILRNTIWKEEDKPIGFAVMAYTAIAGFALTAIEWLVRYFT